MAPEVKTLAVVCPECADAVAAIAHGTSTFYEPSVGPPALWTFCSCPRCDSKMLFIQEDFGEGWDDPWRVFPPQARRMSDAVPSGLSSDHAEATRCLASKCYRATAVMARRILEGICIEQGYKKGVLKARLDQMTADGKIDPRLAQWAHGLRAVGNEGAHDDTVISREDAEEALALAEALLDYLYVFQARFDQFLTNRKPKKP